MFKKITVFLGIIFVIIQFFRPEKNLGNDQTHHIATMYEIPSEVEEILKVACFDCHSNQTKYPWYSNVQPMAWWLDGHIKHGKGELNFSEFTNRRIAYQNHKFDETIDMVDEHAMPLESYTYLGLHKEANLTDEQRALISDWAQDQMNLLEAKYPPDSLKMKRRKE